MGKHSAQRHEAGHGEAPSRHEPAGPEPVAPAAAPSTTAPLPASLAQTAALGAIAVLIVVVALIWSGVEARTAAAAGIGLLVLGAIAVFVIHRTGLLRGSRRAGGRPGG